MPRSSQASEHLRKIIARQCEQMAAHVPGTKSGRNPEDLRRFRIATRRARALLRAARPMLELEWADELRSELAWIGDALGPGRDLDVLITYVRAQSRDFSSDEQVGLKSVQSRLTTQREAAQASIISAIESARFKRLKSDLWKAAESPRLHSSEVSLKEIAGAEFKKLRRSVAALNGEARDSELHRIRVRSKRARYAAELAEPDVGKKARRFIKRAKILQDVIGEHQDAVVAELLFKRLHLYIDTDRSAAFVLGRLSERQRQRKVIARAAFPRAWKKLDEQGKKAWA